MFDATKANLRSTDTRARIYLTCAHMGAIATALLIVASIAPLPDFDRGLSVGVLLVSLIVLLVRRRVDEYIDGLWASGASFAFVAMVVWFLFAPFLSGIVDDLLRQVSGPTDFARGGGLVAITAFFAGFHCKWLRG